MHSQLVLCSRFCFTLQVIISQINLCRVLTLLFDIKNKTIYRSCHFNALLNKQLRRKKFTRSATDSSFNMTTRNFLCGSRRYHFLGYGEFILVLGLYSCGHKAAVQASIGPRPLTCTRS